MSEPDPLATVAQLSDRIRGGIAEADEDRAEAVLIDASVLVRDVADEPDWDADNAPSRAIQIVLGVAQRAFTNPDGLITERLGDASWGWHHGTKPGVYLTKDEAAAIAKLGDTGFRSVTNVTPFNVETVWPWTP
jgi:hypothetical protein